MATASGSAARARHATARGGHTTPEVRRGAEARALALVLLYGEPPTRRQAALRLLDQPAPASVPWSTLATTVCSSDPWRLRARALEALGVAAGEADERTASAILEQLLLATRACDDQLTASTDRSTYAESL